MTLNVVYCITKTYFASRWRNISEINITLKIQAALGWYDRLFSLSADITLHYVHSWISVR